MLHIDWPQLLSGTVEISGSKNATLPLIAASLFFDHARLENVPRIGDVFTFLSIIESLWVKVSFEWNTLEMDTTLMSMTHFEEEKIKKIRVGILLIPVLLDRFWEIDLPFPGWCNLGKRSIDEHIDGFRSMGYEYAWDEKKISFTGKKTGEDIELSGGFAVTATENMIIANAFRKGKTTIRLAAIEPHVSCLIDMLRGAGVKIGISYDHTITIEGSETRPHSHSATVIHDYIESGTFIILAALTSREYLDIHHARIRDLESFLMKCREIGIRYDVLEDDTLRVYNSRDHLEAITIQTNIFPWFPTDLQSPFALLMTQADGISRIHEVLFEWRLNWLIEIEKMKGHIAILNPHEALIFGKTPLRWAMVSSWDLRAGVTMIIAGMIAIGKTSITNVEYIERWYEDIIGKLTKLWAKIDHDTNA